MGLGYLPKFARDAIMRYAVERRPSLVEYTRLLAYHWFRYGEVAAEVRRLGLEPTDWFELFDEGDIPARFRRMTRLITFSRRNLVIRRVLFPGVCIVASRPNALRAAA